MWAQISGIDYVHNDFHGFNVTNYMSGADVPYMEETAEEWYFFTMPGIPGVSGHHVAVSLDVRPKPVYNIAARIDGTAGSGSQLELTNERNLLVSRESLRAYAGDPVSFLVTNLNITKIIERVEIWEPGDISPSHTYSAPEPYGEWFRGDYIQPGFDVEVRAVLADAPLIPIEIDGGNFFTLTEPASAMLRLGDALAFNFAVTDNRYLITRPVMSVYDAGGSLLYKQLFDDGRTHKAASPLPYRSAAIGKTGGVPAKIVLGTQDRTFTFTKELQEIVPNSTKGELFKTIDVIGQNMYEGDQGVVYFGTSPNPITPADPYITAYGEKKLTITVPDAMRPSEDAGDVTYYVKINGVTKSCKVTFDPLFRTAPYGHMAVVSDSGNSHSVIVADSQAELETLKGGGKIIMRLLGDVRYDLANDRYEFANGGNVLINNVATFSPAAGNPLRVKASGGTVTVAASGGKMSVPGLTFVDGQDISATMQKGIMYSDGWAMDENGGWADPGVRNIVFDYETFGLNLMLPVLSNGLTAEIKNAVLLKNDVMLGGKLSLKLTLFDAGKSEFEENGISVDIKRLGFGSNNGNYSFTGVEASGEVNLPKVSIPGIDLSSPKVKLDVNSFDRRYAIEAGVDFKLFSLEGELALAPLNNGWLMVDALKVVYGAEHGIPLPPAVPIGHLTKIGGGFSGLVDTINGNYNKIPPFKTSLYAQFDLVKLIKIEDMKLTLSAAEISFSAKPKVAGIEVFENFYGGFYITANGVRMVVDVEAAILKGFDVLRGGGKLEISMLDGRFGFNGQVSARLQVPRINVLTFYTPCCWKLWHPWDKRTVDIGPCTLLSVAAQLNDAGVSATASVLGFGIKAEYKWGGWPTVGLAYQVAPGSGTLETRQALYDDSGAYIGSASFGGNLSVVARSKGRVTGHALRHAPLVRDIYNTDIGSQITITVKESTVNLTPDDLADMRYLSQDQIDEIRLNLGAAERAEFDALLDCARAGTGSSYTFDDYRHHTVEYPAGIENSEDDYALVISAAPASHGTNNTLPDDLRITSADVNKPFSLKYAEGDDVNAAGANAARFTDPETGLESIMVRLPKEQGTWVVEASENFVSVIMSVSPLPAISKAELSGDNVVWEVRNLDAADDYVLEIRMSTDDGSDMSNADPGILIDEISIVRNPDGTASGTYTIDPDAMKYFDSGDYYPIVSLVKLEENSLDSEGEELTGETSKLPLDARNTGTKYTYSNPGQPGQVASVSVAPGSGGGLKTEWQGIAGADGYIVSVFSKDGTPALMETEAYDEVSGETVSDMTPIMYQIPGNEIRPYSVNLGGLTPGAEYYVEVTAYAEHFYSTLDVPTTLYGQASKSNTALLPLPKYPVLFLDLPGAETVSDDFGGKVAVVSVGGGFSFNPSADEDCMFTVWQDEAVIYESGAYESGFKLDIDPAGQPSTAVRIMAVNADGNMTYSNILVYLDDVAPPLFIVTDEGVMYSDLQGDYEITGYSEPGAIISDDLGHTTQTDANGEFVLSGSLPAGDNDSLRSIRAMDNAGNTETADIRIIRSALTLPDAPGSFTATPGNGQVVLTWTTPSNGDSSAITGYQVSYGPTAGYTANWSAIIGSDAGTTTHIVTGLSNGTSYTFEVRAVNTVGNGTTSGAQTATPATELDAETYTITFNANGGNVTPANATTGTDSKLASLPTPTRTGYAFDGWFTAATGGTRVTTDTVFETNTTIYARWTELDAETYAITFDANGGSVTPASAVTGADGKLASLPTPATRKGYLFEGWYTAPTGGEMVDETREYTTDTTLYAQWTPLVPPKGEGVEVMVDVKVLPTVRVTIAIFLDGVVIYQGTFPKD